MLFPALFLFIGCTLIFYGKRRRDKNLVYSSLPLVVSTYLFLPYRPLFRAELNLYVIVEAILFLTYFGYYLLAFSSFDTKKRQDEQSETGYSRLRRETG